MELAPVFADVDTGVDDAIALIYLLASPDARLVGIASTAGNVGVDRVCENNLCLLSLCRADDVPVSRGAEHPLNALAPADSAVHGPRGLGYAELPPSDRQLDADDAATAWVLFREGLYTTETVEPLSLPILCGLDVTRKIALTPEILSRLATAAGTTSIAMSVDDEPGTRSSSSNPVIRLIEDATRFYLESYHRLGHGYLAHLHDPLAAAVALDPQLVATRQATVDIELTGTLTRGMTVTDWPGRWGRKPNALIGVDVDPTAFFDRFIDRVGPFSAGLG